MKRNAEYYRQSLAKKLDRLRCHPNANKRTLASVAETEEALRLRPDLPVPALKVLCEATSQLLKSLDIGKWNLDRGDG